jgi:hypothetical protein
MVSSIQGMGMMRQMGGMQRPQPLTDEQKSTVKDLLSQYDSENLSATDAKSLFKSFEEAGIKGPGLREAISEAGFDADQVWSLAHDGQKPSQPPQGGEQGMGKMDTASLKTLQSILDQFDLSNMTDEQESDLYSQLSNAGLMKSGSLFDISA